jgi:hypothetical protein
LNDSVSGMRSSNRKIGNRFRSTEIYIWRTVNNMN